MMMMRASCESALAISTICIWPAVERETRRGRPADPGRRAGADPPALRVHRPTVEPGQAAAGPAFVAQENVAGDVEVRREHQLLMDQRDAESLGVGDAAEDDGLAVDEQFPCVRLISAAEDLHQRAFARAVFAHEREHFAGSELKAAPPATPRRRGTAW